MKRRKIRFKIMIILCILLGVFIFIKIETKLMPSAIAISQLQAKTTTNMVVDSVVKDVLKRLDIKAADFYINNESTGDMNYISTNTVLINQLCTEISYDINEEIKSISNSNIAVPIGAVTGVSFLYNKGPKLTFELLPKGSVNVDYETSFLSVGINQTNYQVWLNVSVDMQIVNPLKSKNVIMERKIALVDTLINGKVPERYLNFENN